MVSIDKETIKKLTRLSRIQCNEEEQEKLVCDLKSILEYVEQLQEVDTGDLAPCDNVLGTASQMREDIVGEILPRERFLENVPQVRAGMVMVPPVIKSN